VVKTGDETQGCVVRRPEPGNPVLFWRKPGGKQVCA
jgi:hypothetical protein